ncbi:MAG: universal stress protein [Chloroflexota bacterium]
MGKQILVPLDGTMLAHMALPHAATLARATTNRLLLLHVIPPLPADMLSWEVTQAAAFYHQQQRKLSLMHHYLEATAEDLRDEGLLVHTEMIEGEPASAIVSRAEKDHLVEAIVMSTHSRRAMDSQFVGSVTEKVMYASPVHMLVVNPDEKMGSLRRFYRRSYRTILVLLDGSANAERALASAQSLATTDGGVDGVVARTNLLLLAVVSRPIVEQAAGVLIEPMNTMNTPWAEDDHTSGAVEAEQMRHYLSETAKLLIADGFSVGKQVLLGDPAGEIVRYASQANADLIVMPLKPSFGHRHARSSFDRMWGDSVATKVIRGAGLPVLFARTAASRTGRGETPEQPDESLSAILREEELVV